MVNKYLNILNIANLKHLIAKTWSYRFLELFFTFYFGKRQALRRQLKPRNKDHLMLNKVGSPKIFIPLIETSHYQFYQILGLAKALELRGAQIKLLLCNSVLQGCELKSIRSFKTDPCLNCRFNKNHIIPLFNIETVFLSDFISVSKTKELQNLAFDLADNFPEKYVYNGLDIIPIVEDSVTRYFYGARPTSNSEEIKKVRSHHIETILIASTVANCIYENWKPDIVLNNMNVYSTWEPFFNIANKYDIKYKVVSMSTFNFNSIVLNRVDLYNSPERFEKWLGVRSTPYLLNSEKGELQRFIENRFSGKSQMFIDNNLFEEKVNLSDLLQIDLSKRNVFLFTNIFWDVGLSETGKLYKGVIPWVLDTIEMFKGFENCHLYIKTHPAEVFDSTPSLKGVIQFINEKFPVLPFNVSIIPPELKIKTYDLFPFIDLGLVFNGTLGLEMLLKKIPVVLTGLAPYGYLRSIYSPTNVADYREQILNPEVNIIPDINEVELFAYFYFVKALLPWTLTSTAFGNNFSSFAFNSLNDIEPGKDIYLDHLCNNILNEEDIVVENWS